MIISLKKDTHVCREVEEVQQDFEWVYNFI